MERVTKTAKASLTGLRNEPGESPSALVSRSSSQPDAGTLTRLWLMGCAAYGAKWAKYFGELPVDDDGKLTVAGSLWARGLAGFDRKTILGAFERHAAGGDEWPPNLPQMRVACFAIPSLSTVRADIAKPDADRAPFTRLLWQHINSWAFGRAEQTQADRMLRDAYDAAREYVMRGGELPGPVAGVIEKTIAPIKPASPEVAKRALAQIAESFNRAPSEPEPPLRDAGVDLQQVEVELREHYTDQKRETSEEIA